MPHLSVFQFSDYREYLREYFRIIKQRSPRFSLGAWSLRLNLKSSSTLIMILNGYRNPSAKLVEALIRDIKLQKKEADFFRDLVRLEKAKMDPGLRHTLLEKLAHQHPKKEFRKIDSRVFSLISQWYYYSIRELADLPDFQENPKWIQQRLRFPVSEKQIYEALKTLVDLGLLARDSEGKITYQNVVQSSFDIADDGLKRYHDQILDLSKQSLYQMPPQERDISGMAFTLPSHRLQEAKTIVREMYRQLISLNNESSDSVFQVEVALFPMTKGNPQ